jgi:hypothetical protein
LTVADMNRLEQAARIAMGEFQDSEASAPPPSSSSAALLRLVALGVVAMIVAVALFQLVY